MRLRSSILCFAALCFSAIGLPVLQGGSMPVVFEANHGQAPKDVAFLSRTKGASLFLRPGEASLRIGKQTMRMQFQGSQRGSRIDGVEALSGVTHYYVGSNRTHAPHFARVRYTDIYPGIDVVFYESGGSFEYDFVVGSGADPKQIRLRFPDATAMRIDGNGDLVLGLGKTEIRQSRPVAYQRQANGERRPVDAAFRAGRNREIQFTVGEYDRRRPLVIDPVVVYSALFGGSGLDPIREMGIDAAGNVLIAGATSSLDLPVTPGAPQRSGTAEMGFVAKLNPTGTAIVFVAYLGGNQPSALDGLTTDRDGNVYVAGNTRAANFPVTEGAAQLSHRSAGHPDVNSRDDGVVAKLSPTGSLIYSTYLGGDSSDAAYVIAVDGAGNACIGGLTRSLSFPISPNAAQRSYMGGGFDGFIAKLNASGSNVLYGTYIGGSAVESVRCLAVDSAGSVAAAVENPSRTLPVSPGAIQPTPAAFSEGYFLRLSPDGTTITYSTFLGGNGTDIVNDLAMDATGAVYLTGSTNSTNFVTTAGAYQRTQKAPEGTSGFVMKISPANTLVYSTLLGGTDSNSLTAIAVDAAGNAVVSGLTFSHDFPALYPRQFYSGSTDVTVTKLNATGTGVLDSTFLGFTGTDSATGVAVDAAGAAYVTGITTSPSFPLTAGALNSTRRGVNDGFITKYTYPSTPPPVGLHAMVNAASFVGGSIAPGEIVTLFGTSIGPAALAGLQLDGDSVATTLEGTRVLFDGEAAPLIYASTGQTSAIVPYSVSGKALVEVQVEYNGQRSQSVQATVVPAKPALFTLNSSGRGPGAILNEDGSVNTQGMPAAQGSVIILYGTGGGAVTPVATNGGIATGAASQDLTVAVEFGTGTARQRGTVLYAGSAPGLVNGVMQINVRMPSGLRGTVPLRVIAGTAVSPDITVAVQ
jgi:uncharacterized protein (TIGR03437 family)